MKIFSKNQLVKPPEREGAKLKVTVATVAALCIVCTVFFASLLASGCKEKEDVSKMDEATFLESLNDAPEALASKNILPEWLQKKLESLWESYVTNFIPKSKLLNYSGEWNNKKVYYLWHSLSSDNFLFYLEDGTRHPVDKSLSDTKNWVLVYQIKDGVVNNDYEAYLLNYLESTPFVDVPKEDLPKWLNERIDMISSEFVGHPLTGFTLMAEIFRGKLNEQTVYHIFTINSGCMLCIFDEDGKPIVWEIETFNRHAFLLSNKTWELIFRIVNGELVGGSSTKSVISAFSAKTKDKYDFPNFKPGTSYWNQLDVLQRIAALQIPEAVLTSISTAGLLETCLEFPYLLNIICSNDYQHGFENGLLALFNGFRELMVHFVRNNQIVHLYYCLGFLRTVSLQNINFIF